MKNKYLKIKDAAEFLGVSRETLRNWDNSGKLKARRHPINNFRLYSLKNLKELEEQYENL